MTIKRNKSIMRDQRRTIEETTKITTTKIIASGRWKETGMIIKIINFIIIKIKRSIISKIIFTEKLITDRVTNTTMRLMKRMVMFKIISRASRFTRTFRILKLINKTFFSK